MNPNYFERRPILTEGEMRYFPILRTAIEARWFLLFAKVRLADIVTVKSDALKRYPNVDKDEWWKIPENREIMSKHVDFCVCASDTLKVSLIIELDDKSHDDPDRIKRDKNIDAIFTECKIRIMHLKYKDLRRNEKRLQEYISEQLRPHLGY